MFMEYASIMRETITFVSTKDTMMKKEMKKSTVQLDTVEAVMYMI